MRLRRPLTALLAAATLGALVAPAAAQPSSSSLERRLASAEEQLAALEGEAAEAVEDYNEPRAALDAAEADLEATAEQRAATAGEIEDLRVSTDAIARTLYKGGGANLQFGTLLSSDGAAEAGSRYATVQRVLRSHRGDVEALQAAQTRLAELEARAAALRDDAATTAAEVEQQRARVESTLAAQADRIGELEAEVAEAREREEAAQRAEEARQRAEEEAAAEAAARAERRAAREAAPAPTTSSTGGNGGNGGNGGGDAAASPAPAARGSAQVAVDTALAQVGKPYQYGANGPDSFDCSGLTSFAWRAAGVDITRTSRSQYAALTPISRSELQPGDLIFFRQPISHVAMYIGNGQVVEASRTGVPVRVSSQALSRSDITGYRRP